MHPSSLILSKILIVPSNSTDQGISASGLRPSIFENAKNTIALKMSSFKTFAQESHKPVGGGVSLASKMFGCQIPEAALRFLVSFPAVPFRRLRLNLHFNHVLL